MLFLDFSFNELISIFGYFAISVHTFSTLDKSVTESFNVVEAIVCFQVCVTVSIALRLLKKYSSIKTKTLVQIIIYEA
jgi:hypothetical protein